MIVLLSDARVWLGCDYRGVRKGMDGLAMLAQQVLAEDSFSGALFAFRGKGAGWLNCFGSTGRDFACSSERLEKGHFQ